jgi:hypothetical protein
LPRGVPRRQIADRHERPGRPDQDLTTDRPGGEARAVAAQRRRDDIVTMHEVGA